MTTIIKRENGATKAPNTFGGMFDQMFRSNLGRFLDDDYWGFNGQLTETQVPVNLRETDVAYEMQLVAPGLKKQDFKINVNGNLLTVSFEHKEENKDENNADGWLRQEFRQRSFSRSFNLGDTVEVNKITATYNDGLLHLVLPKHEKAKSLSRTIEIQ